MYLKKLRDLREDHDLFQKDIAALLHITQQQYSLYENGTREIPLEYVIILSKLYNVSLDYMVGNTNIKNPDKNQKKTSKV